LVLQGDIAGAVSQTLTDDMNAAVLALNGAFDWVTDLDDVRQRVMANLCFQLGIDALKTFTTFLGYMSTGNYEAAADDLAQTKLARETPERCQREIVAIRTGAMP
ncbi:MAG: lysozyme family protein, partial [Acidobacteriaceae bacterium]